MKRMCKISVLLPRLLNRLCLTGLGVAFMLSWATASVAQSRASYNPLVPTGPHIIAEALDPTLIKWYLPQELYREYGWKSWEYTNYAKEWFSRYTDVALEGSRFYDLYGNYVTKGWKVYDWTENQPAQQGSQMLKAPQYKKWFGNVVVSSASKGRFYTALTAGDVIRTTMTPLTFSKPSFNGLQWDFLTDKYGFTMLASRISDPTVAVTEEYSPGSDLTGTTVLYGFRGTVQLGGFATLGATYVNAHNTNMALDLRSSSFKGVLTEAQHVGSGFIDKIVIRLSDDSPEDGEGAVLFSEKIFIDSGNGQGLVLADIKPTITGGALVGGLWQANGPEAIELTYDIKRDFAGGDYRFIKNVVFDLWLANDYRVEIKSNLQTNVRGEQVHLLVTRALGNVKDGSNQKSVRFQYGLPTGNEVYGVTLEIDDLAGFNLRAEYDINRRFRRFPNRNYLKHPVATDKSDAFYVAASQIIYPLFLYGEVFSMDKSYSTTAFICDQGGFIDYENDAGYLFEFVDDNDDQDRFPDWDRKNVNQRAEPGGYDVAVFPGLDENNDLVSDFNQNDNLYPDYKEPFLKYNVDPPEFLFGMDMNNNTVVDRFENDNEADYLYKKDHRGYNVYTGVEIVPGIRLTVGHLNEWLLSKDKKSRASYGVFTLQRDYAGLGRLQIFNTAKMAKDDIPDDLYQWVQPPLSRGMTQKFDDPLIAQDTFINSAYLRFDYTQIPHLNFINKFKYQTYDQQGAQKDRLRNSESLGIINKADYSLRLGKQILLMPKWKSMYYYHTPAERTELKEKELSEILSLMLKYTLSKGTWLELGYEGTWFTNFIDMPPSPPADFVDDYKGNVLAIQFSNLSDYLGYKLNSKVGFRWERLSFEYTAETNTVIFVRLYAGVGY